MKIAPDNVISFPGQNDDLTTGLCDRIREAHATADASAVETDSSAAVSAPRVSETATETSSSQDAVGAKLRSELEGIVAQTLAANQPRSEVLLERVVGAVVEDRFARSEMPDDAPIQRAVCQTLLEDPVVIAELDEILQEIARQLALHRK